ncbi:6-phosphofructo-2-kinase/fructose-2,6-bisphosphatase [Dendrobium catenatum]|uniref:6-phosphofructo-2-kinase/fructose-2, 6-bisphosphatase n=1 Tax=Dendrobium catenatum TaxID=906689 RepID=UPI0009F19D67|nr:6-phosphofructo-2-kinase/fructose-2,6-bisphosphatase [Dendrobium catenatum]
MGGGSSKCPGGFSGDFDSDSGSQLYVSLKIENLKIRDDLIPHVFGSIPIVGSWDSSRSLSMERESALTWELSFVVPPNHGTLVFKFLLKSKEMESMYVVEEGEDRLLTGGKLEGGARAAVFRLPGCCDEELLEYKVFVIADIVSPFDLAASWRAYKENLRPSTVRGVPDICINAAPEGGSENVSAASLELDLERYVVPSPTCSTTDVYAANLTEAPRSLAHNSVFTKCDASGGSPKSSEVEFHTANHIASEKVFTDIGNLLNPSKVSLNSVMANKGSDGMFSPLVKQGGQRAHSVDCGFGSPRFIKSATANGFLSDLKYSEAKAMPAAAGAVAAAAVADQMQGPKEDQCLAIVLVGLPARGKTFTAVKLTRYLRWLGHETKHFNVGKYRRLKHGVNQAAEFFRGDNPEGVEARNEVAALAMDDMISWMQEGGQVGIFDATNSTKRRRNMIMKMAEGKCKIIFLETICNDERIIERNIRLKIQQSPDYEEETDFEAGIRDFKERLANYEKVYEPVEEGCYVKMIDKVSGNGGQIQVNNISGYLPGRIVFFLVNTHLTPRPILLTRHGESQDNVRGRIGGDAILSEAGEVYSGKLANFINKRLQSEKTVSIWTSTLQRTILTATPIVGFPKIQWRALEEINAGACDGMTYEEIKRNMPDEYESRQKDKLRYRYPRGESYLDVIQRLEPVIIELERQRAPVVVISHQAVLRALYAYFADRPLKEIPQIEVPLHTIIEIQMGVTGVQEKRYKLMD